MTLVVALRCKDGIVMASDGQATGNSAGGPVRHEMQKIFPVGERTLYGASGTIGMIQKSLEIIHSFSGQLDRGLDTDTREKIRESLFALMRGAAEKQKGYYGNAEGAPLADIIISTTDREGRYRLWHIGKDGNDELLDEIGYACTGGGDIFAYTILRGFDAKNLEMGKAKLLLYRVIKDAIEVGAYGLGGTISIWAINGSGNVVHEPVEGIGQLERLHLLWRREEQKLLQSMELAQPVRIRS